MPSFLLVLAAAFVTGFALGRESVYLQKSFRRMRQIATLPVKPPKPTLRVISGGRARRRSAG